MNAMTEMPAPLVFTDAAAAKVKNLIDEEGNADLKLQHPAEQPAPPVVIGGESENAKPRRTGWWARRLLGDKG